MGFQLLPHNGTDAFNSITMIAFKNRACLSRSINFHQLQPPQWMKYNKFQIFKICTAVSFEKNMFRIFSSRKTKHIYSFGIPPHNQQQQIRYLVWHAGYENLREANMIIQEIQELLNKKANFRKDDDDMDHTTKIQVMNQQLQKLYEQYQLVTGEEYEVD